MNDKELEASAYLLIQQVKIAVSIAVIRLTPPNMDVKNYAAIFQRKFRRNAKRINLQLERKLFYEQLLVLLPAFKIYSASTRQIHEPMDIDDEPIDSINTAGVLNGYVDEKYSQFLNTLNSISQFLDAVLETVFLSAKNENITKHDIRNILSKFQETQVLHLPEEITNQDYYSSVSSNLIKYVIKSFDTDRIIVESTIEILKSIQDYFCKSSNDIVNINGLISVKYASEVLLKCFENHPQQIPLIFNFVRDLMHNLLCKDNDLFCYWYVIPACWKSNAQICIRVLNSLFSVIADITRKDGFNEYENLCGLLYSIKKLTSSYYKLHANTKNNIEKEAFEKSYLKPWENVLKKIIILSTEKREPSVTHLGWNCLQMIMLLKCKATEKNVRVEGGNK